MTNDKPIRIQRSRKKGWRKPPNTIYVGRPTKWGNPFSTAEMFREYQPKLSLEGKYASISEIKKALKGRNLACWCNPTKQCHADILLEIANDPIR